MHTTYCCGRYFFSVFLSFTLTFCLLGSITEWGKPHGFQSIHQWVWTLTWFTQAYVFMYWYLALCDTNNKISSDWSPRWVNEPLRMTIDQNGLTTSRIRMSWKSNATVTGPVPGNLGWLSLLYPSKRSLCKRVSFTSTAQSTTTKIQANTNQSTKK